ncbi:MAG: hypothetical protein JWO53_1174 [Chlamydiia bacterium]|nr:hypothetical protein [Chlamydiia bacterium]
MSFTDTNIRVVSKTTDEQATSFFPHPSDLLNLRSYVFRPLNTDLRVRVLYTTIVALPEAIIDLVEAYARSTEEAVAEKRVTVAAIKGSESRLDTTLAVNSLGLGIFQSPQQASAPSLFGRVTVLSNPPKSKSYII